MIKGAQQTQAFRPFVPALRGLVAEKLKALLGLPSSLHLDWDLVEYGPDSVLGTVQVTIMTMDSQPFRLEFGDLSSGRQGWVNAREYQIGYHNLEDGSDPLQNPEYVPFLNAVRKRFEQITTAKNHPALEEYRSIFQQFIPYREVNDSMYRQLTLNPKTGPMGTLRLGFRCNQDCWFCWQGRDWPDPPHDFYFQWLDHMAAAGVRNLAITGGEPTIHKLLPTIIERATRKHDMMASIQTNAIRLAKPNYLKQLRDAGLHHVFVSLHSADPEVSNRMMRAPGTFRWTVKGTEACLEAGVPVHLNTVIEHANYKGLPDHARMVVERFVDAYPKNPIVKMVYSHPSKYYDASMSARAIVPLDELRPYLVEAIRILQKTDIEIDVTGSCGFPPCIFHDAPDLISWVDRDTFDGQDLSGRYYGDACQQCAGKDKCLGIRKEYADKYGERGIEPFDPPGSPPNLRKIGRAAS
ncbi:MAG: hypothetical protein CMH54_02910 [Myxococcales bacterium]|nr:hypothetical protein [Myxococcales bacterium]